MGWFDEPKSGKARAIEFAATGKVERDDARSVNFSDLAASRGAVPDELPVGLEEISSSFVADGLPQAKWRDKDIEEARREGYEEGFEDGRATAERVVDEMKEDLDAKLEAVIQEVAEFEQRAAKHVNAVAATLARVFAENFLRRQMRDDDDLAIQVSRDVIRRACGFETIHLYVHPEMAGVLQRRQFELRPEDPVGDSLRIHPDDSLAFGDIRLMADGGQIESLIDERLERLVEAARMELDALDVEGIVDFDEVEDA